MWDGSFIAAADGSQTTTELGQAVNSHQMDYFVAVGAIDPPFPPMANAPRKSQMARAPRPDVSICIAVDNLPARDT